MSGDYGPNPGQGEELKEEVRGFIPVAEAHGYHGEEIAKILIQFPELKSLGDVDAENFEKLMDRVKAAFQERSGVDINSGVVHQTYDSIEATWKAKHPELETEGE